MSLVLAILEKKLFRFALDNICKKFYTKVGVLRLKY